MASGAKGKAVIGERRWDHVISAGARLRAKALMVASTLVLLLGPALGPARAQPQAQVQAQDQVQAQAPTQGQAEIPNVSGRWAVAIELDTGRCRWEGSVTLRQLGTRITGRGRARPVDRDRRCPPLGGDFEGAVTGPRIGFGFATGTLGQARAVGLTPVPDAITAHLSAELKAAQARLTPSDAPTMAVTLARLADFARSFSLPLDDISATVAIYRDALADLPGDLLMDGVARTIATHRYHNMPKPGEIRARVEGELITRRARLAHARLALSRSRR